mgnify:FL=1
MVSAFLFLIPNLNAQIIIEQGKVKANFGIDADVKADSTKFIFPNSLITARSDDWFAFSGASGLGVIDATMPYPVVTEGGNQAFTRDMSVPNYTVKSGNLWIDAAYVRDPNWAGKKQDFSIFKGTSNKNADNPTSWQIITGSNPAKNDLIDVYGHVRKDGQDIDNDLWVFLGASTRSENGASYLDFEFFRSEVTYNTTTNVFGNSGSDG